MIVCKYVKWDARGSGRGSQMEDSVRQRQEAHEYFPEEVPLELALRDEPGFPKYRNGGNILWQEGGGIRRPGYPWLKGRSWT